MHQDVFLYLYEKNITSNQLSMPLKIRIFQPTLIGRNIIAVDKRNEFLHISREHCYIVPHQHHLVLFNRDPLNGTYINSIRINAFGNKVLKPGDLLTLGTPGKDESLNYIVSRFLPEEVEERRIALIYLPQNLSTEFNDINPKENFFDELNRIAEP